MQSLAGGGGGGGDIKIYFYQQVKSSLTVNLFIVDHPHLPRILISFNRQTKQ